MVTLAAILSSAPVQAQSIARLSRDVLDVTPPSARVQGGRGEMRVMQTGCRARTDEGLRRRIVDIAVQEWAAFGFQTVNATGLETRLLPPGVLPDALNPPRATPQAASVLVRQGRWEVDRGMDSTIAGYWSAVPGGSAVITRQNRQWRQGMGEQNWVEPWSAAFISWVMCEAGLGEARRFQRDAAHRVYIDQAIRARDGRAASAAYVAHDAGEVEIAPGDLLCNGREGTGYRRLADRRRQMGGGGATHCDIVVRVGDGRVNVIGGNVLQGVTLTTLPLIAGGAAHPRVAGSTQIPGARTIFAHLRLRGAPVEPEAMDAAPTILALNPGGFSEGIRFPVSYAAASVLGDDPSIPSTDQATEE